MDAIATAHRRLTALVGTWNDPALSGAVRQIIREADVPLLYVLAQRRAPREGATGRPMTPMQKDMLRRAVAAGYCTLAPDAPPRTAWSVLAGGASATWRESSRAAGDRVLAPGFLCGETVRGGRFVTFIPTPAGRVAGEQARKPSGTPRGRGRELAEA